MQFPLLNPCLPRLSSRSNRNHLSSCNSSLEDRQANSNNQYNTRCKLFPCSRSNLTCSNTSSNFLSISSNSEARGVGDGSRGSSAHEKYLMSRKLRLRPK